MRFLLPFLTEVHFPLISDRNKNPQRNDVPERLEISHARNEKDHSLDAPYVENFSHTEYQSEATVYAYLKQVSDFLKRYQELDAEYALLPPEPYDPQNYLLQWRLHMRELINELFNMFVGGNLFSTAAMTRTLMECCVYGKVLKQEKSARLLEDWFLCGMIRSLPGQDGALRQAKLKTVYALCSAWNREPEETIRRFKKGNENEWLVSVIPGKGRIYFSHVCEYLQETELYQTYQWACAFVHGQDIRSKMHPFTFYDSTYHLLTVMMSYIFRAIRLYPVSEELEAEMQKLERDLAGNHQLGQKRMTGLRGGCTGCRGADGALPKASKIQKERHLLSADVSLSRRDGQNRYFKISKRYRRPTPPAFWPAAHLRRTGALP